MRERENFKYKREKKEKAGSPVVQVDIPTKVKSDAKKRVRGR